MGSGRRGEGWARGIKAVYFKQGTREDGDYHHEQETAFPGKGIHFCEQYAPANYLRMLCVLGKKDSLCAG
jgi:hypothetical protein